MLLTKWSGADRDIEIHQPLVQKFRASLYEDLSKTDLYRRRERINHDQKE